MKGGGEKMAGGEAGTTAGSLAPNFARPKPPSPAGGGARRGSALERPHRAGSAAVPGHCAGLLRSAGLSCLAGGEKLEGRTRPESWRLPRGEWPLTSRSLRAAAPGTERGGTRWHSVEQDHAWLSTHVPLCFRLDVLRPTPYLSRLLHFPGRNNPPYLGSSCEHGNSPTEGTSLRPALCALLKPQRGSQLKYFILIHI